MTQREINNKFFVTQLNSLVSWGWYIIRFWYITCYSNILVSDWNCFSIDIYVYVGIDSTFNMTKNSHITRIVNILTFNSEKKLGSNYETIYQPTKNHDNRRWRGREIGFFPPYKLTWKIWFRCQIMSVQCNHTHLLWARMIYGVSPFMCFLDLKWRVVVEIEYDWTHLSFLNKPSIWVYIIFR